MNKKLKLYSGVSLMIVFSFVLFLLLSELGLTVNNHRVTIEISTKTLAQGNDQTAVGDYTPTNISVCKLGSTTATVCWKTKKASNSELLYGETTPNILKRYTNFTLTDHSIPLQELKPNTKYLYVVRSSPDVSTTSTKSEEYSFTTKKADGSGGDKGGAVNSSNPDPTKTNPTKTNTPKGYTDQNAPFPQIDSPITGLTRDDKLPALIIRVIQYSLGVIALVAVIVITLAGFRMIVGSGNEEQHKKARLSIIWAITGLILALLSFSIVTMIQSIIQP